ncbi:CBS domain-containing protein [uncultured Amphritea sp.]|uniref:CBS domain-containing protein n=1 Tax=uncultured Amphritea sp. TaxID=981605 RepID=UPI00262A0592|nr:CBS domain-containing protein [uncultured Amphritea sp.]
MNNYNELKTILLDANDDIARPYELHEYTLDTHAIEVMTDFEKVQPLMMEQDVSIDEARQMMRKVHVRSILVIDKDENFRGLLTIADLESRSAMSIATSAGLKRHDISIKEVMTPRERLHAMPLSEINHACIGDLLRTLQHTGTPHMLVVDTTKHEIRGVISSSDIARRLKVPVEISKRAAHFREVVNVLFAGRDT